ncbi:hypothetical protein EPYR_02501 [Erwinia pyrifoliae DSM 12163]|nr:hypothetical protein EPYR_02501 [Erwinia pyrifoliae DSM 12163]
MFTRRRVTAIYSAALPGIVAGSRRDKGPGNQD